MAQQPLTVKFYDWSPYDLSDSKQVFILCPHCDWKAPVRHTKDQKSYFNHCDEKHPETVRELN